MVPKLCGDLELWALLPCYGLWALLLYSGHYYSATALPTALFCRVKTQRTVFLMDLQSGLRLKMGYLYSGIILLFCYSLDALRFNKIATPWPTRLKMAQMVQGILTPDRIELNKALAELLVRNSSAAMQLLREMDAGNLTGTDTVNTVLSHILRGSQRSLVDAQRVFNRYFDSNASSLRPNTVSLNIMLEGCRLAADYSALNNYFILFRALNLSPDKYTYSTLVRCSRNETEIIRLLGIARAQNQLTAPLLRAGVLSLGIHGANPADIISLAFMFSGSQHPQSNAQTGDTIVSALLQPKTSILKAREKSEYGGLTGFEIARACILDGTYSISSRGFCSLFTYMHRNELNLPELRDSLWTRIIGRKIAFDGRLTDAYLRCFGDDVRAAMLAWKRNVRPQLRCIEDRERRHDIVRKSMEAIIYACGQLHRPDIALEVAISIRGKKWTTAEKRGLARAYVHGRSRANLNDRDILRRFGDFLFTGFERSLEIELGVALANPDVVEFDRLPGRNIRLIFGNPS